LFHGDIKPANIFFDFERFLIFKMTTDISSLLHLGESKEIEEGPSKFLAT
jgi:serine/threonine protein kinase